MTTEATPGALGLGEGLGPLPEPLDWPDGEYTAQDMRAERERCYALGVAAECERCAKLCETWMEAAERESGPEAAGWLHQMAQHMRNMRA